MAPHHFGGLIIFRLLFGLGALAGWIILLVAIWRIMRAQEAIADALRQLAARMNVAKPEG